MRWIFAALGFVYGRFWGALIGYMIGSAIESWSAERRRRGAHVQRVEVVEDLITLVVAVARADGDLDRSEVRAIRRFFELHLGFRGPALDWLRQALQHERRSPGAWPAAAGRLASVLAPHERAVLLRVLVAVAWADGRVAPEEQALIQEIATVWQLGFVDVGAQAPTAANQRDERWARRILGVEATAPADEVDRAYKALVREKHPDRFAHLGDDLMQAAHEQFVEIQEAYQILVKRRESRVSA